MDDLILLKNGITPSNPIKGYLPDFMLKVGNRATLIPCKNEKSYGIVMTVDDDAIGNLYSEASVADYIPEEVTIITATGDSLKATCYNLPPESLTGRNESYARSLYDLAKQKDFPDEYLEKIRKMSIK